MYFQDVKITFSMIDVIQNLRELSQLGYNQNRIIRTRNETREWKISKNKNQNETRNTEIYESITELEPGIKPGTSGQNSWFN